jgi:hypothetical protein
LSFRRPNSYICTLARREEDTDRCPIDPLSS